MSFVVKVVKTVVSGVVDAVEGIVSFAWDETVMPIAEVVVGIFGVEDETIVDIKCISVKLYEDNLNGIKDNAITQSALSYSSQPKAGILSPFLSNTSEAFSKIENYYSFGLNDYPYALPESNIRGSRLDNNDVKNAVENDTGLSIVLLTADHNYITSLIFYKYYLQTTYNYQNWTNTLTYVDEYGSFDTYTLETVTYEGGSNTYNIAIKRPVTITKFYLSGYTEVLQGNTTGTYTISSDRVLAAGASATFNLSYSGTAVNGTHYTSVNSVTILENTDTVNFTISTFEVMTGESFKLIPNQTETSYSNNFVGGDSLVDSSYAVDDTITLNNNDIVTVNSVDSNGDVNTFTVTTINGTANNQYVLNQISTTGSGVNFSITVNLNNLENNTDSNAINSVNMNVVVSSLSSSGFVEITEIVNNLDTINTKIVFNNPFPVFINNTNTPFAEEEELNKVINRPAFAVNVYITATYYTTNEQQFYYWLYDTATNVLPNLKLKTDTLDNLQMMPIAILRTNNTTVSANSIGEINFEGVKNLVQNVGLTFESLKEQVESSPDIGLIKEAYLNFGVNPSDNVTAVGAVLFEQFFPLTQTSSGIFNTVTDPSQSLFNSTENSYIATFEEQNVKRALVWSKQEFYNAPRSIGTIGSYLHYISGKRLFLLKQITVTECVFIVLHDLSTLEFIKAAGLNNTSASKLGDENFNIPLSYFAANSLSFLEQLELYPYALRLNIYAVRVTELAWYKTEAFTKLVKIVLIIIIVVVTVMTLGKGTAAVVKLAITILASLAIAKVAIALMAMTDNDFLKAVIAVAAVAAMFAVGNANGGMELLSAEFLLMTVTTFSELYVADITVDTQDVQEKLNEFKEIYSSRAEEIQKMEEAVESGIDVEFIAYLVSPSTAMYRAIGIQYDFNALYNYDTLVGNYYDNALKVGVQ